MPLKTARINVVIDTETKRRMERWSEAEGRSNRRHLGIVTRRLGELMEERPQALAELGLLGPQALREFAAH